MGINTSKSNHVSYAYNKMNENKQDISIEPNVQYDDINLMDIHVIKSLYKSVVCEGNLDSCNLLMDILPTKIKESSYTNNSDCCIYKKMLSNILNIQLAQNFATGYGRVGYYLVTTNLNIVDNIQCVNNMEQFKIGIEYLRIFDKRIKKFPLNVEIDKKLSKKAFIDKLSNTQYYLLAINSSNQFILNQDLLNYLLQFSNE